MTDRRLLEAINNIEKVVVGKRNVIELLFVGLLSEGHVLLEDVPGVGKTMLVKAIAKTIGADFKRIQFTPDLLPSDVTGVSIYNQKTLEFEFRPGPIMANIVLADEINRTSPKTQSALLEALEESHVTVDGQTRALPSPFFVMATQNPIEYAGTFPLPEAQLDRFMLKLNIGYPTQQEELEILSRLERKHPIETLQAVLSTDDVKDMQQAMMNVFVDESIRTYILNIVNQTRDNKSVRLGVSPRGSVALMKAGQAYAYLQGRDYCIPDDIKYLASYVLAHRIVMRTDMTIQQFSAERTLEEILNRTPVPIKKEALRK